ncbi:MAG: hypothetical protein K2G70_04330 [Turicibacter sp.]|nr:hypothetical protein [Turicibacter sp.]
MSLKENYELLEQKALKIKSTLQQLQEEMTGLEKRIQLVESDPNFLETQIQPLYELLWDSQISYKHHQVELNTLILQLQQFQHILKDIQEVDALL